MHAKVISAGLLGIDAYKVEVEVDAGRGLQGLFTVVGLPDAGVKESRDRVQAALKNAGWNVPVKKWTVNLAPADVKKEGPSFDLPIALGMLVASGQLEAGTRLAEYLAVGELALDGAVRPVRGALPLAVCARDLGCRGILVPAANADEAAVVEGVAVIPVETLNEAAAFLEGTADLLPRRVDVTAAFDAARTYTVDLSDLKGQEHAKRALEVAAAGGHNILMLGPPGSGKTMLARRLPTIIPDMTLAEALETTKVHSVCGVTREGALVVSRPFRAPHHTVSEAGLVGGGSVPKPGEVSLAHNGVLFLDELPEFKRSALEVLRQPLEDGSVTISRAKISLSFPARFMLAAAMNPCPCGWLGSPTRPCRCSEHQVKNYLAKISGPLLDRVDIQIEVPAVRYKELTDSRRGEPSAAVRARVNAARAVQHRRFAGTKIYSNAQMTTRDVERWCVPDAEGEKLLRTAIEKLGLTARAYHRVLKLARTIADLAAASDIAPGHVSEAIQYRTLDRHAWA